MSNFGLGDLNELREELRSVDGQTIINFCQNNTLNDSVRAFLMKLAYLLIESETDSFNNLHAQLDALVASSMENRRALRNLFGVK